MVLSWEGWFRNLKYVNVINNINVINFLCNHIKKLQSIFYIIKSDKFIQNLSIIPLFMVL